MERPISSRVRLMLALCLMEDGMPSTKAVDAATMLISRLRARGFDIVHKNWVEGAVTDSGGVFSWDEVASMAEKIEEDFGRKPWMP